VEAAAAVQLGLLVVGALEGVEEQADYAPLSAPRMGAVNP